MKARKYFVRCLNTREFDVVTSDKLLDIVTDFNHYPLRIIPLDKKGNLLHKYSFLVGDDYSLSFIFNDLNSCL